MAQGETYEEFVDKFKPKKTTDDCYTPALIYDAVADWVANEYNLDRSDFVRPFYPGGDYENFDYPEGSVVVDNPPFSILSKIVKFYIEHGIKFFLFAPALTLFGTGAKSNVSYIVAKLNITYENGAVVPTSFVTNLEDYNVQMRTAPALYDALKRADDEIKSHKAKTLPKYIYPDNVVTASNMYSYSEYGIDIVIPRDECSFIRALDSQKSFKKTVYGDGFLVSDRCKKLLEAAKEKAAKEKAAKEKAAKEWKLSERELEIISKLSNHSDD